MDEIIEFIKDILKYVAIIAIIILVRIFILTTTEVVGPSMEPNLYDGNILLVDQMTYRFNGYNRFDVIVFERSPSYLIKRIIGLPGETIEYKDDVLLVNGKAVKENFKHNGKTHDFGPVVVPAHRYFVLGDNRINSTDSRNFNSIKEEAIVGKPFFGIWPFNKLHVVK